MSVGKDFVAHLYGKPVVVKMNFCTEYRGVLVCLDNYLNVALRNASEYNRGTKIDDFEHVFIRGNNVWFISEDESAPAVDPIAQQEEQDVEMVDAPSDQ